MGLPELIIILAAIISVVIIIRNYILPNDTETENKANLDAAKKGKSVSHMVDTEGAGVRDLIEVDDIDEAVRVYAAFMGVDQFTAQEAVEQMQREFRLSDDVSDLLADGRKLDAIKQYQAETGVDLATAKAAIEEIHS